MSGNLEHIAGKLEQPDPKATENCGWVVLAFVG